MTECRVVVVRDIGNLTGEQGKWIASWMDDPLDGVHLVLVAGGTRIPAALANACKASANVVGAAGEQTAATAGDRRQGGAAPPQLRGDSAHRDPPRRRRGPRARAGRAAPRATYGDKATLDVDAVEAYLGELGTAGRFDLTNAIDRGELGTALEVLHRLLTATSASQPKPLHPMQVMASLVFHYQRLLRLDDPAITTKEQAAEVLGMKSAGGARFPLEAARKLGSDGLREALGLLAQAELDLRGQSGFDERTAIDVLVARLAALSRRHARGTTRGDRNGCEVRALGRRLRLGRRVGPAHHARDAASSLVLVHDALGAGLAQPLLRRLHELRRRLRRPTRPRRWRASLASSARSGRPCCGPAGARSGGCASSAT